MARHHAMGFNVIFPFLEHCSSHSLLRRYGIALLIWTLLLVLSAAWNVYHEKQSSLSLATVAARASLEKDLLFREWVTRHGGIYVPPTEQTPPNPYLHVPGRDETTLSGKQLTLLNPAYALRDLQSFSADDSRTKSHVTSLHLMNPNNAPDAWEKAALESFNLGTREVTEVTSLGERSYLRLMQPFVVKPGCLKCHDRQGYKAGDIRGGISVSVALAPYLVENREHAVMLLWSHGAIWLAGLIGMGISYRRDDRFAAERSNSENRLCMSEEKFHTLFDAIPDSVFINDLQGRFLDVNKASCERLGYSRDELLKMSATELDTLAFAAQVPERIRMLRERGSLVFESEHVRKNGLVVPIELSCRIIEHEGHPAILGVARDITERKQMEEQLRQSALYDRLTGLPNRRLLDERLKQVMAASKRNSCYAAVMFIDLDNFKPLNDTYGHGVGDLLLAEVALRLKRCVRETDTVARFGGDEFVVLLCELSADKVASAAQACGMAERMLQALSEPFLLNAVAGSPVEYRCTASIGVNVFINHDATSENLLRQADEAMYRAKAAGRNTIRLSDEEV